MSFSTSISGLDAAQERMAVISNNIVNAGTVGFKKGEAQFGDLFSSALQDTGASAGTGVELTRIRSDFTQGEFQFTSSALDLAIDGSGFSYSEVRMARTSIRGRAHFNLITTASL